MLLLAERQSPSDVGLCDHKLTNCIACITCIICIVGIFVSFIIANSDNWLSGEHASPAAGLGRFRFAFTRVLD